MPMMPVRPVLMSGGEPSQAAMRYAIQANALAGMNGMNGVGGLGVEAVNTNSWTPVWQQLALIGASIGGQIALNKNQAVSVQSRPEGTTVYYPAGGTTAPIPGAGAQGGMDSQMMWLLLGGAAIFAFYMAKR